MRHKKIIKIFDNLSFRVWFLCILVISIMSLIWKSLYDMNDFPYFAYTKATDVVLIICVIIIYIYIINKSKVIEKKVPYSAIIAFFAIIAISFVVLLPINPISDPEYIVDGALALAKGDLEHIYNSSYLQSIVKNLKLSSFYALFAILLPKNVLSLRFINVILYLLTAYFCGKIAKNICGEYEKTTFIITASFLPLIIYTNQVYFDLPVLCLGTLALWVYTNNKSLKNIILCAVILGLAGSLRVSGCIFVLAILIDYIFGEKKEKKTIIVIRNITIYIGIVLLILWLYGYVIDYIFRAGETEGESIWSLFWMGINEPEFGMMHNEYQGKGFSQKTFGEFCDLLTSRNITQNMKLFGRKILWTWTQGTYQCQRYGFGYDVADITGKFIYDTPIEKYFVNTNQLLPTVIISLARSQYMALWIMMIVGLAYIIYKSEYDRYRPFVYSFIGTFIILIFYEMKSRYVFHLITCMVILAVKGMAELCDDKEREKVKKRDLVSALKIPLIISLVISSLIVIIAVYISRTEKKEQQIKTAQKNAAVEICINNGLTLIERTAVLSNISKEYQFLYLADTHALIPTMDNLPAWNLSTESRLELFKNSLGLKSSEQFGRWIQVANTLDVDAFLMGGDIVDYGDDQNLDWLANQLEGLRTPYIYTLGNHDSFDIYNNIQNPDNEKVVKLFRDGNVDCSYIDYGDFVICQVNDAYNYITKETLEEFKNVYGMGKPIILILHVPLCTDNTTELRDITRSVRGEDRLIGYNLNYELDKNTKEFIDMVLAEDSPIFMTLSGHVHFNHEDMLNSSIVQYTTDCASSGQAYLIRITQ